MFKLGSLNYNNIYLLLYPIKNNVLADHLSKLYIINEVKFNTEYDNCIHEIVS